MNHLNCDNNVFPNSSTSNDQIFELGKQLIHIWSQKVEKIKMFSIELEVQHLMDKIGKQEETISSLTSTITPQSLIIMQLESTNSKFKEKVVRLIYVDNVHHLEKQMFGATSCNCEFSTTVGLMQSNLSTNVDKQDPPITTREDHDQPADQETARYISPPKTNFNMQQAKQMQNIDSKDKVWISKMLEVTQNLSTKYAIPSHLVEDKKKKNRPSLVPQVFGWWCQRLPACTTTPATLPW